MQSRVATGLRVETAADSAAYWSIATTMRSDNKALSAVEDAHALSAAKVDVAYNGMDASVDILDEIKVRFVTAREPGVDRGKVQKDSKSSRDSLSVSPSPPASTARTGSISPLPRTLPTTPPTRNSSAGLRAAATA